MNKQILLPAIAAVLLLSACTSADPVPPAPGNPPVIEDPCPRPDGRPCN